MSFERRGVTDKIYIGSIIILIGFYAFQLWFHATRTSATVYEPVHILAGYLHWCGDFGFNPEHPPLSKLLATAPLLLKDMPPPPWECGSRVISNADSYLFGNLFLIENGADNIVLSTRLSAALVSLVLALLLLSATSEMFGRWPALTALILLVFEPNLIAHGSLTTPDMFVAAGFFGAVYALYRYVKLPTPSRLITCGLAVGITLSAKHSGILLVPLFALILIADALSARYPRFDGSSVLRQSLRHIAAWLVIFVIGFTSVWAVYGFRYSALPGGINALPSENRPAKSLTEHAAGLIRGHRFLPEAYNFGLANILVSRGQSIIFDQLYATGKWFYFPLALVVKTSTALLLLLVISLLSIKCYRGQRREMLFLLLPPIAYFSACLLSNFNNGIRHLLPVYPFLIMVAAAAACHWARQYRSVRSVVILLLLFHAANAMRTAPNHLAFANELSGGTGKIYRIFRDSNVEAQQNLKLVAEYISGETSGACWFAAYGSAALAQTLQPCHLMPSLLGFWYTLNVAEAILDPVPPVVDGPVLLSVKMLPPSGGAEYLPIAKTTPVAQIGGSVFVYRGRFEVPLLAALSHARRAQQMVRRGRFEEAIADGQRAVALAPNDPRSHFWLGMALARARRADEARLAFETAMALGQKRQAHSTGEPVNRWFGDVDDFSQLKRVVRRELEHLR